MILITGSLGLVGSTAVRYFLDKGESVIGVDNNMRKQFFGEDGDVSGNQIEHDNYSFYDCDYRNCENLLGIWKPDLIIHCASQPSHDWAVNNPMLDFSVNAEGTLYLLEAFRRHCPDGTFIYVSTNKVYGDNPNNIALGMRDGESMHRFFALSYKYVNGIDETMPTDICTHSLFGVSKLAGDLYTQEYGRYFGLNTGVFRCGCITGANQKSVELHGFLAYVARCKRENKPFVIYGYDGKQVRDIIHAHDLVNAFYHFSKNPKKGEVYNMGGGCHSNISVLEALKEFGIEDVAYSPIPRKGDHKWYISDVRKFMYDFPLWQYEWSLKRIIEELKCVR